MNSFHVALSILFQFCLRVGRTMSDLKNPDLETRVWFADIFLLLEIHQFLLTLFCSLL